MKFIKAYTEQYLEIHTYAIYRFLRCVCYKRGEIRVLNYTLLSRQVLIYIPMGFRTLFR